MLKVNIFKILKFDFCMLINMKVFYKLIVSLWVYLPWHARSTQNNKFAISLRYLKENVKDKFYFLPAERQQRFLQIDTIILDVFGQVDPNSSKKQVCYFFATS